MGCPETLITDQGREFVNELSTALYAITNTEHRITIHRYARSGSFCMYSSWTHLFHIVQTRINLVCMCILLTDHGLTERFNQTISRCLAKLVDESQTNWDEKINTVLMGYRASRQASTKHSPYFLLCHQQMCLPIDSEVLPSPLDHEDDDEEDLYQKIQILLAARQKVFKEVEANIEAAQKSQKKRMTENTRHKCFLRERRTLGEYLPKAEQRKKNGVWPIHYT